MHQVGSFIAVLLNSQIKPEFGLALPLPLPSSNSGLMSPDLWDRCRKDIPVHDRTRAHGQQRQRRALGVDGRGNNDALRSLSYSRKPHSVSSCWCQISRRVCRSKHQTSAPTRPLGMNDLSFADDLNDQRARMMAAINIFPWRVILPDDFPRGFFRTHQARLFPYLYLAMVLVETVARRTNSSSL